MKLCFIQTLFFLFTLSVFVFVQNVVSQPMHHLNRPMFSRQNSILTPGLGRPLIRTLPDTRILTGPSLVTNRGPNLIPVRGITPPQIASSVYVAGMANGANNLVSSSNGISSPAFDEIEETVTTTTTTTNDGPLAPPAVLVDKPTQEVVNTYVNITSPPSNTIILPNPGSVNTTNVFIGQSPGVALSTNDTNKDTNILEAAARDPKSNANSKSASASASALATNDVLIKAVNETKIVDHKARTAAGTDTNILDSSRSAYSSDSNIDFDVSKRHTLPAGSKSRDTNGVAGLGAVITEIMTIQTNDVYEVSGLSPATAAVPMPTPCHNSAADLPSSMAAKRVAEKRKDEIGRPTLNLACGSPFSDCGSKFSDTPVRLNCQSSEKEIRRFKNALVTLLGSLVDVFSPRNRAAASDNTQSNFMAQEKASLIFVTLPSIFQAIRQLYLRAPIVSTCLSETSVSTTFLMSKMLNEFLGETLHIMPGFRKIFSAIQDGLLHNIIQTQHLLINKIHAAPPAQEVKMAVTTPTMPIVTTTTTTTVIMTVTATVTAMPTLITATNDTKIVNTDSAPKTDTRIVSDTEQKTLFNFEHGKNLKRRSVGANVPQQMSPTSSSANDLSQAVWRFLCVLKREPRCRGRDDISKHFVLPLLMLANTHA